MLEALPPLTQLAQRIGNSAESRRLLTLAARYPLLTRSHLHRSLLDAVAAQHGEDVSDLATPDGAPEAGALWALADQLLDRFFAGLG